MANITANRSETSVLASTTCTVGATLTSSSTAWSTVLTGTYVIEITNGGTGPTVGVTAKVQSQPGGGSTWVDVPGLTRTQTNVTASAASQLIIPLPRDIIVNPTRISITGNTGQTVTVAAWVDQTTSQTVQ
jgi:hypothetical protein